MKKSFKMLENEKWWGVCTIHGNDMPFTENTDFFFDYREICHNQGMPLLLSDMGRYIWSDNAFCLTVKDGIIITENEDGAEITSGGATLREAYIAAMRKHFPFSGKMPPKTFFETAQYNTWMEYTYFPTEEKVLSYAKNIIENGFRPGILIIDEGWHNPYGDWSFDELKFPHPKEMIEKLHNWGFTVMLWVSPFVTASGLRFVNATNEMFCPDDTYDRMFLRTESGEPALTHWWDGYSAILDMTDEANREYLDSQLRRLMKEYGVDGFKFDGGSVENYQNRAIVNGEIRGTADGTYSPVKQNIAWNEFGTRYAFHEYKDTFLGGGKPTVQRTCDRGHLWDGDGINTIVPGALVQGLMGYPFICPDMIGGGQWSYSVDPDFVVDEELFIRMAQVSVFFPMMQFSWAPWRALSEEGLAAVKKAAILHSDMAPEILAAVKESAVSGEPVVRSLEYMFPHKGYALITDEYMCGDSILVCPVVTKGTIEKDIVIPPGTWETEDGQIFTEGTYRMKTPVGTLLWLKKRT